MDKTRRKYLKIAAGVTAGAGALIIAKTCNVGMMPAKHLDREYPYIDVDLSKLESGQMLTLELIGRPVYITKRPDKIVKMLRNENQDLVDPLSEHSLQGADVDPELRSVRADIFVSYGVCTHLGCAVQNISVDDYDWGNFAAGGYICPCHGALFDAAGRVYKNYPALRNMDIPSYRFLDDDTIRVIYTPLSQLTKGQVGN